MRKYLFFITILLTLTTGVIVSNNPTAQAETYVYTTATGSHYFYNRNDRGLSHAKKVYKETLSQAQSRGLTLSGTESNGRRVVAKTTGKKIKRIKQKANAKSNQSIIAAGQVVVLNHNRPSFTKAELSLKHGAWAKYGQLDSLNRATTANAMLNYSLMPKAKRLPLYVDPTGWHNKKAHGTWLYNRSHLIGYQFTGQNNNLRNLITGTRSLNDPAMSTYENQVAAYIRSSRNHYVRYQVQPVFHGKNLLASGVVMQAQSIGSSSVSFHIYIKNIESGFKLNYLTGTSVVE